MNAFIQNYNGEIAIYDSTDKNLIEGGFVSVAAARAWAIESPYAIVWVATTEVVKTSEASKLAAQLQAVRGLRRAA